MIIGSTRDIPRAASDLLPPDAAARLDRLDILSRRVFAGRLPGERRAKAKGQSVEFDEHRAYVGGDDLRHIDWNVLGRLDRLVVKRFREDRDLSLHLCVDVSNSMLAGRPSKLLFALRLAFALAHVGLVNRNRVSAGVFGLGAGSGATALRPMRGRSSLARVGGFLIEEARRARSGGGEGEAGRPASPGPEMLGRLPTGGRGLLVVVSDFLWFDGSSGSVLNAIAGGTRSGRFDATCVRVMSRGEADPRTEAELRGDVRLSDAETGRAAELTIGSAAIEDYRAGFESHARSLREACVRRGVGFAEFRSDEDAAGVVLAALRKRGVVG